MPISSYDTYGTYSNNFNEQPLKHKGNKKKGSSGGGVTDLLSGFINSYTKPKPEKGYSITKLPTYLPPSPPKGNYAAPIYVGKPQQAFIVPQQGYAAPVPEYIAPLPEYIAPLPEYSAPQPLYPPQPNYGAPKPHHHLSHKTSYVESSYSEPTITNLKPKYVHTPARVSTVYTHTIAPVEATKVQHLHSHTHVYHGAQVIKPGEDEYGSSNYGTGGLFQKKSDAESNILSANTDNFGSGTSFVSSSAGASSSFNSVSPGKGFINTPLEVSSSTNIDNTVNPFDLRSQIFGAKIKPVQQFASNGNNGQQFASSSNNGQQFSSNRNNGQNNGVNGNRFSSHTQFIADRQNIQSQTNNFQADNFQPSQTEFGFKPSLTIEDMINQNHLFSQTSRTIYNSDCHCVSEQFCAPENVVRGQYDLSHVIDARNQKSQIYSNRTSAEDQVEEDSEIIDNNRLARSFNFSEIAENVEITNSTDAPFEYDYYEPELPSEKQTTIAPEVVRRRRGINETQDDANFSDVQGVSSRIYGI